MKLDDICSLVEAELAGIAGHARRTLLSQYLTPAEPIRLFWEYGEPDEQLDCWRVGQSHDQRYWLLYCETGFGPSFPWGTVSASSQSLGNDSQWHSGLEDAAIAIRLLPAPPGYEAPGPRE
jgi:hypothetical protein